ncbi:MAG TPA: hypothetical protein VLK36_08465 [Gaiellaceae bacterium]|nr:hypothetical protein [Gaiellaceae bacterium]
MAETESEATPEPDRSASELIEQVGRDAAVLMGRELQLTASRHGDELRAAVRNLVVVGAVAVAFATAFALGNWAIVEALAGPLSSWSAPLVVAAGWALIGVVGTIYLGTRPGAADAVKQLAGVGTDEGSLEKQRDQAEEQLRGSLADLSGAVASETGVMVAAAIVPMAGGAVDAGEKLLDVADGMTDRLEESGMLGGRIVNQAFDVALLPGRTFIRVTTRAFRTRR